MGDLGTRDEREDDIARKSGFEVIFNAKRVGGIDEDAGMLGSDHRFDNRGQVIDIGKGLHAQKDVVECAFIVGGSIFRSADNCSVLSAKFSSIRGTAGCPHHSGV